MLVRFNQQPRRKGLFDIPLMFILVKVMGEIGVLWATPIAEVLGVIVAFALLFTFLKKNNKKNKVEEDLETI